jgi:sterol desaturase/sphingolipid hydroxylase (fatty acid hydroxylase superfamily)
MTAAGSARFHWVLHPAVPAFGLVLAGVQGWWAGSVLLLLTVAGAAAGFANSGST